MAIDIEWQSMPPSKNNADNRLRLFLRIVNAEEIDDNEVASLLAAHSNLSRDAVLHVLEDLSDVVASLLRKGKEINLSSLGRLRLSLGTETAVTPDTSNTTQGVRVRGINLQPNDTLLQTVGKPSFRTTARNADIVAASAADLLPRLKVFMQLALCGTCRSLETRQECDTHYAAWLHGVSRWTSRRDSKR